MANPRQAAINARMLPWGEREIARFEFRHRLFVARGFTDRLADAWGDVLALRDQERDDRRACIECKHWLAGWRCARRQPIVKGLLMRCPSFAFEKP